MFFLLIIKETYEITEKHKIARTDMFIFMFFDKHHDNILF